jgi:hypothetical protein
MAEVKVTQALHRVELTEYDRFSGSKHWETKFFDNEAEARKWVADYNNKYNNLEYAPDWYVRADYTGKVN